MAMIVIMVADEARRIVGGRMGKSVEPNGVMCTVAWAGAGSVNQHRRNHPDRDARNDFSRGVVHDEINT